MGDKKEQITDIQIDLSNINNQLHSIVNSIVVIRHKLQAANVSFSDISFDESRLVILEKAIKQYSDKR